MKVLFVQHVADMYGASQSLLRLTRALLRDGDEVCVVLQEDGPLKDRLLEAGARVLAVRRLPALHRNRLKTAAGLIELARNTRAARKILTGIIRAEQPDIVHNNTAAVLPVAGDAAARCGVPFVQHYRESFLCFGPLWKMYRCWLTRRADRVIAISDYLAGEFTGAQRKKIVRVVRNGIPKEDFIRPSADDIRAFREAWGLNGPVITCIGRINPARKGQETLLRAAALLKDRFPDARFVFVGAPFRGNEHHLDTMKKLIGELGLSGHTVMCGQLDDVRTALASSDLSIMASSIPEGLGNVTIESLAMGVPVVGTRIGGTPELIAEGVTGFVVPPSDPRAMADAIARILSEPGLRESMSKAALEYFSANLSFEPFYKRIRAVYDEAVKTARS